MSESLHSVVVLPDGAKLAYEIIGIRHLGHNKPIVLVCGMTAIRGDWERLATSLSSIRPVLIYDHRGMGDSTFSTPARDDEFTVESLARDLFYLLSSLEWKDIAICGFSMGGVISQQLMFLPYHPLNPTPLPFRVSHVLLTATFCTPLRDKRYGLRVNLPSAGQVWTEEEKKALRRSTVESTFDSAWLQDQENRNRLNWWLDRAVTGRPADTIMKQRSAVSRFDFTGLHEKLPRDTQFLVIQGLADQVVPFYCAEEILRRIPWAQLVRMGNDAGQVPDHNFGHHWFEYLDSHVWRDVVEVFLRGDGYSKAQL